MVIKSQHKVGTDQAQREYWWRQTPQERLAAAARLVAEARRVYAANLAYDERIHKSATPVPRGQR